MMSDITPTIGTHSVDVGGVYDPATHRYDHHQRGFTETFTPAHSIKLSSAGLIYKHFGKRVIREMYNLFVKEGEKKDLLTPNELDESTLDIVYDRLYNNLIKGIDGVDNGITQYDTDVKQRYSLKTDLASRVDQLNPQWNEKSNDADADKRFLQAVKLTGEEFSSSLRPMLFSWIPARRIVEQGFKDRYNVDPTGSILLLSSFTAWKSHLYDIEEEANAGPCILFVLYEDMGGQWRVHDVGLAEGSFEGRMKLPEPWRGRKDDELVALCGISGAVFVHANGFIGGAKSKEAVLTMARKAIEWGGEKPIKGFLNMKGMQTLQIRLIDRKK